MKNQFITGRGDNMINTVFSFIRDNWGDILAACGILGIGLEIAPAQIKPVSWILKKIGKTMNAEIIQKVEKIEKEFEDFKKEDDIEKINNIRKEIADFSLSCQRQEHHTSNEFDRIFTRVGDYHNLLKKYKMENGKIDTEVAYITKVYQSCLEENKFFMG